MNRRNFLASSVVTVAVAVPAQAATRDRPDAAVITAPVPDGLNPPGIRTGGVKMVPVVGVTAAARAGRGYAHINAVPGIAPVARVEYAISTKGHT